MNSLQQQSKFDDFLEEFSNERPDEALARRCPSEVYTRSARIYRVYPFHDKTIQVLAWHI